MNVVLRQFFINEKNLFLKHSFRDFTHFYQSIFGLLQNVIFLYIFFATIISVYICYGSSLYFDIASHCVAS